MFIYQLYIQVVQFIVSLKHQKKDKGGFDFE